MMSCDGEPGRDAGSCGKLWWDPRGRADSEDDQLAAEMLGVFVTGVVEVGGLLLCLVRRCLPGEVWEVERGPRRHGRCGLLDEKLLEKQ